MSPPGLMGKHAPEIGLEVLYGPHERFYDLVDGLDTPRADLVVCRIYRIVALPEDILSRPCTLEPFEGGDALECFVPDLHSMDDLKKQSLPENVRLVEKDELKLNSGRIGLFLKASRLARRYPGNIESLWLNGLDRGKAYRIIRWSIPGLAVELDGVTGTYYGGLFRKA